MKSLSAVILIFAMTFSGCYTEPRKSDSGHMEFYRQALPKILGRRATGYHELRFLSDATTSIGPSGRRVVVQALMQSDEYVDHWENVLVDKLRVHRDDQTPTHLRACYTDATTSSADTARLAETVRDYPPYGAHTSKFTMTDLIQSALRLDDLSPVYRAALFPMTAKPITGADISEKNRRDNLATRYLATHLDRDLLCTECHNSKESKSGEESLWDRTYPVPGYFEQALFGFHKGRPLEDISTIFRTPLSGVDSIGGGGHYPWGLEDGCGEFQFSWHIDGDTYAYDPSAGPRPAYFASIQENSGPLSHSVFDIEEALRNGVNELRYNGLRRRQNSDCRVCATCEGGSSTAGAGYAAKRDAAATALRNNCIGCHGAGGAYTNFLSALPNSGSIPGDWDTPLVRVEAGSNTGYIVPGDINASEIYQRVLRDEMPFPSGFSSASAKDSFLDTLEEYINALPDTAGCDNCADSGCDNSTSYVQPDSALAFVTAMSVVNQIFEEVYGYPLTIANHFPRNGEQMGRLWNLTEFGFLGRDKGWSLRTVLERLIMSSMFNRMAPAVGDGSEPYEIVPVLEPWSVADPRDVPSPTPEQEFNAMTDGIHAHSAYSRLRMLHRAMGWPEPMKMADSRFPSAAFQSEIGRFVDDAKPGFRGVDFGGLLAWEDQVGRCEKPSGVTTDYIDGLMGRIASGPSGWFAAPYTYADAAIALKDRLLNDTSMLPDERAKLETLFGVSNLNVAISASGAVEQQLRDYCGVLLETPQFLLAGLPVPGSGPGESGAEPRIPSEDYDDACERHRELLAAAGYSVDCSPDDIWLIPERPRLVDHVGPLFTGNAVARLRMNEVVDCQKGIEVCLEEMPICDPSCISPACCGEDVTTIPADVPGSFVSNLEGAYVDGADGVEFSFVGEPGSRDTLQEGMQLEFGMILHLSEGDHLKLMYKEQYLHTPEEGVRKRELFSQDGKNFELPEDYSVVITGPTGAEYAASKEAPEGRVSDSLVKTLRATGAFRNGTAGVTLPRNTPIEVFDPKQEDGETKYRPLVPGVKK